MTARASQPAGNASFSSVRIGSTTTAMAVLNTRWRLLKEPRIETLLAVHRVGDRQLRMKQHHDLLHEFGPMSQPSARARRYAKPIMPSAAPRPQSTHVDLRGRGRSRWRNRRDAPACPDSTDRAGRQRRPECFRLGHEEDWSRRSFASDLEVKPWWALRSSCK